MAKEANNKIIDILTSLSKRRGFVFQSSEIYGGLASTWDYGPLGVELKRNIKNLWWKSIVTANENVVGMDAAILVHPKVWEASGHVENFHDPLIDNKETKKRYRVDHLLQDQKEGITFRGDGEFVMRVSRFLPDFLSQTGNTVVELDLRNFPNQTAASSSLGPFTITSATNYQSCRARGRSVAVKISNTAIDSNWKMGTFRLDVHAGGRR